MAVPQVMKAYRYSSTTGGLDKNLRLVDCPVPQCPPSTTKKPCILVAVASVSLNPADYKVPEDPIVGRLIVRRPAIPCLDFAGRIVEIPPYRTTDYPNLDGLKPGDLVFGRHDFIFKGGALAEYTLAQPSALVRLPEGLTPAQGAAIGTGGLTAYQSLATHVRPGHRVFVNGGSGGVGTFTIQIAKMLGASHVTTTCSAANAALCRELGADVVLDYHSVDVAEELKLLVQREGQMFDHVVDNTPVLSGLYEESPSYLREDGTYVQVNGTMDSIAGIWSMATRWMLPVWLGGTNRRWSTMLAKNDNEALQQIAEWVQGGKMKVIIDSEHDFCDARQAFARLKTGRAKGKVIVNTNTTDTAF